MSPNRFSRLTEALSKIEPGLFACLLLLHLLPIFSIEDFATIDGPAHSYNAYLIYQLLFENAALVKAFYSFNAFWVPNSLGHYLLVFLQIFFSPSLAEKLLLAFQMIGLAYASRLLWKQFSSQYQFWSYFAFPLAFSLSFFFGFYNYTLAAIFYIFLIAYQLNRAEAFLKTSRDYLFLITSLALIYFSHSLLFALAIFSLFCIALLQQISSVSAKLLSTCTLFLCLKLFLCAAPFLAMGIMYFSHLEGSASAWYFMPLKELLIWFVELRTLIVFNSSQEVPFTQIIATLLAVFFLFGMLSLLRKKSNFLENKNAWIAVFFLLAYLVFYFTFPEYTSDGGIIIIRIQWLFLLFFISFLSLFNYPTLLRAIAFALLCYAHFHLSDYYLEVQNARAKEMKAYNVLKEEIKPSSVVLALTNSGWTKTHFNNAIGLLPNTIVLYNYEALKNYFPLQWNTQGVPKILLKDKQLTDKDFSFLPSNYSKQKVNVDYVLLHKADKSLEDKEAIKAILNTSFYLMKEEGNLKLYAKKSPA